MIDPRIEKVFENVKSLEGVMMNQEQRTRKQKRAMADFSVILQNIKDELNQLDIFQMEYEGL